MFDELEKLYTGMDANSFIELVDMATNVLRREKQAKQITGGMVDGRVIKLTDVPDELFIVGDLHGDLRSLLVMLNEIDFENKLADSRNKLIFLGDYVDRGTCSVGVLYVICYLKHKFPNSVILMRGNHEAPMEFPFSSHDLPIRLTQEFGKNLARSIYFDKILHFFQLLSLFVFVPEQILMVHGGLPTEFELLRNYKAKAIQDKSITNAVMEELLWNDPIEHIGRGLEWEHSRRGYGKHFGIEVSKKWLNASAIKLVVRGHEPCQGFKINHGGRILTLFTCREAYPNFGAAYLTISADKLLSFTQGKDFVQNIKKLAI